MNIYNITLLDDEADISLKELPVKFIYKDSRVLGYLALFFGAALTFIPPIYLIKVLIVGESLEGVLVLMGMPLLFSPLFSLGLNLVKKKKEITISREEVGKVYSTLFKKEDWKEPISAYQGILLRTDVHASSGHGSTLTYVLDLLHHDPGKTIRLFKSMEYQSTSNRWKEYCQLFNCTPLERVGKEKIIQRNPNNIAVPLIDLVKNNEVILFTQPPARPEEVEIQESSNGERVLLPKNNELFLGRTTFTLKQNTLWKSEMKFDYTEIRSVLIDYSRNANRWAWAIVVITRNSSHRSIFAHDLDYKILEWLQWRLTSAIIDNS